MTKIWYYLIFLEFSENLLAKFCKRSFWNSKTDSLHLFTSTKVITPHFLKKAHIYFSNKFLTKEVWTKLTQIWVILCLCNLSHALTSNSSQWVPLWAVQLYYNCYLCFDINTRLLGNWIRLGLYLFCICIYVYMYICMYVCICIRMIPAVMVNAEEMLEFLILLECYL